MIGSLLLVTIVNWMGVVTVVQFENSNFDLKYSFDLC